MTSKCSRCSTGISRKTRGNHLVLEDQLVCRDCILDRLRDRIRKLAHDLLPALDVRESGPHRFAQAPANSLFHALNDAKVWLPLEAQIEYVNRLPDLAPQPTEDGFGFVETYRASAQQLVRELKNGDTQ